MHWKNFDNNEQQLSPQTAIKHKISMMEMGIENHKLLRHRHIYGNFPEPGVTLEGIDAKIEELTERLLLWKFAQQFERQFSKEF